MNRPIIEVRGLGKRYTLGAVGATSLREELARRWDALRGRVAENKQDFWALRDVSFDIHAGEVVGIIGRNGAGKSTLLKILSRITEPTTGTARLRGRVASLLEVGTGFHPELTGRENVFLNGAILGMSRAEIRAKFDEIVAFSEVDTFIDTPVKRYSSGMYVRLAFAVAAHLDPEILIVDEVLAVGDAQFQKKCLGKIREVSDQQGRTVFFVSHTMAAVATLCSRAIFFSRGRLELDGTPDHVISRYINEGATTTGKVEWPDAAAAPGNARLRLRSVAIVSRGEVTADVRINEEIHVAIEFSVTVPGLRICSSIHLLDRMGVEVLASANLPSATLGRDDWFDQPYPQGNYRTVCVLPANFLNEGSYSIRVALCTDVTHVEFLTTEVVSFTVHDSGEMRREYSGRWLGVVRPRLAWRTMPVGPGAP